jgi:alpha-glucosidase
MKGYKIMSKAILSVLILFLMSCLSFANISKNIAVKSPDNRLQLQMGIKEDNDNRLYYNISFRDELIIEDSELGIEFKQSGKFAENVIIENAIYDKTDETYKVPFGKSSEARNHYNQVRLLLKETNEEGRKLEIIGRVFNDGVAFRYVIPQQTNIKDFIITSELTNFNLTNDCKVYGLVLGRNTHFEGNYAIYTSIDSIPAKIRYPLPLLLEHPAGIYMAISEAQLIDYAGMSLIRKNADKDILSCSLTPWPEDSTIKVKGTAPYKTPWRVIMIGENPGTLIESNIIINLNDPCALTDISWIKPGKTTWPWWNGHVVKNENFAGGMNYQTMKHYIDFCAKNHIAYHSLTAHQNDIWYGKSEYGVAHTRDLDPTTPLKELDFDKMLAYARDKDVGIRLWLNYDVFETNDMDSVLDRFRRWGIKGFMFDFIQRDDQHAVNLCLELIKKCADRHIEVNLHGASKPTGLRRTYPNLSNVEGVLNLEWDKWSERCTPEHDLIVPFTRMLAGPMDYHLGGFRALAKDSFVIRDRAPFVMGTRCHQMAMYVVYENYLPMICDYPAAYENQTGFDFIVNVPVTWDETRVINAKVGDYLTIARRYGEDWYIGSMTDWSEQKLEIPLKFLDKGNYQAIIYSDAKDADIHPNNLIKVENIVNSSDVIQAKLAPGGGQVIKISPIAKK